MLGSFARCVAVADTMSGLLSQLVDPLTGPQFWSVMVGSFILTASLIALIHLWADR